MAFIARTVRTLALFGAVALGTGLLATALPLSAAQAQTTPIVIQGNTQVEPEAIRAYYTVPAGQSLTQARVEEGTAALRSSGLFRSVSAHLQGGRLVVNVSESELLNRVVFEGNRKVKSDVLQGEVQSRARAPLSREVVESDVRRIYEVYRRLGRYDVVVEPKTIPATNGRTDLVFEIVEGKKTTVKKIEFVGNEAYSGGRLRDVISTAESGWLSWLKNNDVYDPDRINVDQETLRRFYLRNGYADFRIVSASARYDDGEKGFFLTIAVSEGQQYRFGAIDIASTLPGVNAEDYRSSLVSRSGSTYNVEQVDKSIEAVATAVAKRGFAFAQVRPRGDRDASNRTVNITYVIEEGPHVYVERINVRGNTRTQDRVIRREFDIVEGDAYNRLLVDRAERRLKNLGFFESIRITTEPGSSPDRVVLNVDAQDKSTGEFSVGGGYSTSDGFIAEASVTERNFLGRGQFVRLGGTLGQRSTSVDFSFTEPFFMDYRLAAGFDLFYKRIVTSTFQPYDSNTMGGTLRVGIPVTENLTLTLRYTAYSQYISIASSYTNCDPTLAGGYAAQANCVNTGNGQVSAALLQLNNVQRFISMPGYSLTYNSTDNLNFPTTGFLVEVKQDIAGLGGDAQFVRSTFDGRAYYEVYPEFIGTLRVQGGHIASLNSGKLAAIDQYFKGPELVRGFASSGIGPRDLNSQSSLKTIPDALGGTAFWGTSAEVTFPLAFLPRDLGMRGAVFADAGSVFGYNSLTGYGTLPVNIGNTADGVIRSSVGLGLLWQSPFGPIRFDYSFILSKADSDQVQQFRFSGGTRF
jgi:outer membrane protein insertion porin family